MLDILTDKNAAFLLTAYGVFLGALLTYLISLNVRNRAAEREEMVLQEIEVEKRKNR
jgi:hypothetical protein